MAADLCLSAFGRMQADFRARDGAMEMKMTLSVFFLGLCAGRLIYGPAIDSFGRRRPLLIGVALYRAATFGAMPAGDPGLFVAMRFAQALGAAAGMVIARAVASDFYEGREAARAQTLVMTVVLPGPIFAPTIGGLIVTFLPWQACFAAMLAMGLLAAALAVRILPETLRARDRAPLRPRLTLARWGGLLREGGFMAPPLTGRFAIGVMMSFIAGYSALFMGRFGLSQTQYAAG